MIVKLANKALRAIAKLDKEPCGGLQFIEHIRKERMERKEESSMNVGNLISVDFDEPEAGEMILHISTKSGGMCAGPVYWTMKDERDEEIDRLKKQIKQIHKDYGCEVRDPCGTIWEHAAKLEKENAELKSHNDLLSNACISILGCAKRAVFDVADETAVVSKSGSQPDTERTE